MRILAVIPARYGSTRFPGKPLADIAGKTLIQRVVERAARARLLTDLVVATDDERILNHVLALGHRAVMTRADHPTGTDRLAEVARTLTDYHVYLNIQGDEPLLHPEHVDALAQAFVDDPELPIATLVHALHKREDLHSPTVAKVVRSAAGDALYFSRSPIPYLRNAPPDADWTRLHPYWKHIGLYGFSAAALQQVAALPLGSLEQAESLEQLRWLEAGLRIHTRIVTGETQPVDLPEDVQKVVGMLG